MKTENMLTFKIENHLIKNKKVLVMPFQKDKVKINTSILIKMFSNIVNEKSERDQS